MTASYVYYDQETDDIVSISNHIKEFSAYPYIKVDIEEVRPVISGKRRLRDYCVMYNRDTKEYQFVSKIDLLDLHESQSKAWNEAIFKIPYNNSDTSDLLIKENIDTWELHFSKKLQKEYCNIESESLSMVELYVTREDDANVLLSKILFRLGDIPNKDKILIKKIDINEPYSIYCRKRFESYSLIKHET